MTKKHFSKIIFFVLAFSLLFLSLALFYNHNKEVKAQEVVLVCDEEEIQIGEALEDTKVFVNNVLGGALPVISSALDQVWTATVLS